MSKHEEKLTQCTLCIEDITDDNNAILEPCKHTDMCITCAKKWCNIHHTCPFCRGTVIYIHSSGVSENSPRQSFLQKRKTLATHCTRSLVSIHYQLSSQDITTFMESEEFNNSHQPMTVIRLGRIIDDRQHSVTEMQTTRTEIIRTMCILCVLCLCMSFLIAIKF